MPNLAARLLKNMPSFTFRLKFSFQRDGGRTQRQLTLIMVSKEHVCVRLILANFVKSYILGLNLISQLSSYTFEHTELLLNI